MKRNCKDCGKRYVTSKSHQKYKSEIVTEKGDENMCDKCLRDGFQIEYEQSYFGSINEWGGLASDYNVGLKSPKTIDTLGLLTIRSE